MSKKLEKLVILDLTKSQNIPIVKCFHDSPQASIFSLWTEKGERIDNLDRIKHDTEKIVVKKKTNYIRRHSKKSFEVSEIQKQERI